METERTEIERTDTGLRTLYSLLFWLIAGVLEAVLGILIVFNLLYTLVTGQLPPERLREFGNRIIAYFYRIGRYLTYNESALPFPFSEFPPAIEAPCATDAETWGQDRVNDSEEIDQA
ncbi:MAG: DUF4389 domain-containing protein [Deltaproteobacteria bacterium]|nr:DUF4389 domain-containing protein [Deltaproteobacteria bacterium]